MICSVFLFYVYYLYINLKQFVNFKLQSFHLVYSNFNNFIFLNIINPEVLLMLQLSIIYICFNHRTKYISIKMRYCIFNRCTLKIRDNDLFDLNFFFILVLYILFCYDCFGQLFSLNFHFQVHYLRMIYFVFHIGHKERKKEVRHINSRNSSLQTTMSH